MDIRLLYELSVSVMLKILFSTSEVALLCCRLTCRNLQLSSIFPYKVVEGEELVLGVFSLLYLRPPFPPVGVPLTAAFLGAKAFLIGFLVFNPPAPGRGAPFVPLFPVSDIGLASDCVSAGGLALTFFGLMVTYPKL